MAEQAIAKQTPKQQLHLLGQALFFAIMGFCLFQFQSAVPRLIFWLLALLYLCLVIWRFFQSIFQKKKHSWWELFLQVALAVFFLNNALFPTHILAFLLAFEFFAMGIILLINAGIATKAGRLSLIQWLDSLIHIGFGLFALVYLDNQMDTIYRLMGLYFLYVAAMTTRDALVNAQPEKSSQKRRRGLSVPVFLSAILPVSALRAVNRLLDTKQSQKQILDQSFSRAQDVDLEVWIHTARKGFEMMGHVDISYQGVTYAYGQYDTAKSYLGGTIGDGVLFTLPSQDYMDSLAEDDWRVVFGYGLSLTEAQKKAVEASLAELMADTKPFLLQTNQQEESYLGKLTQRYKVSAYKFDSYPFKTYFVMTTNCVLLADRLLAGTGIDLLDSHGILTPGIYQDYFEREYQKPYSNVITKFVLGKQVEEEKK